LQALSLIRIGDCPVRIQSSHVSDAEASSDNTEHMRRLGASLPLDAVGRFDLFINPFISKVSTIREDPCARRRLSDRGALTTLVKPHPHLLAVQKMGFANDSGMLTVYIKIVCISLGYLRRHRLSSRNAFFSVRSGCISGSRSPSLVFVELGTSIVVAPKIDPFAIFIPCRDIWLLTAVSRFLPSLFFSAGFRSFYICISSSAASAPSSITTNPLVELES